MATCWECDATTSRPITATIELSSGQRLRVQVCPSCAEVYCFPIMAEFAAGEAASAPSAASSARRAECYTDPS
jgi:hypothetical protein